MRWPYPRTPELGKGLPATYEEGEREFDRRVKSQFPLGSCEDDLIAQVAEAGFRLDRSGRPIRSATLTRGLIIKTLWSVRWRSSNGRIDEIWGIYGAIAP